MDGETFLLTLQKHGFKQAEFARLIGKAPRTISKWVNNQARVEGSVVVLLELMNLRPELVSLVKQLPDAQVRTRDTEQKQ